MTFFVTLFSENFHLKKIVLLFFAEKKKKESYSAAM